MAALELPTDVVGTNRAFSKGIRLVAGVGSRSASDRARFLVDLRSHLEAWNAEVVGLLGGVERMLRTDVAPEIDAARKAPAAERRRRTKEARRLVADAKVMRGLLAVSLGYLETKRSIAAELGAARTKREMQRAREVDRANAALRASLERAIEATDDVLDVAAVVAARIDPENDAAPKPLTELRFA